MNKTTLISFIKAVINENKMETFLETLTSEHKISALNYYKKFKEEILTELFDTKLEFIKRISPVEYSVGDRSDIDAIYTFRKEGFDNNDWSVYWEFSEDNKDFSQDAWKKVLITGLSVIKLFVEDKNPDIIEISGDNQKKTNIYKYEKYLKLLKVALDNKYSVVDIDFGVKLVKREISGRNAIQKRMRTLNETHEESLSYWNNGNLNDTSRSERWRAVKIQIERETVKEIFKLK